MKFLSIFLFFLVLPVTAIFSQGGSTSFRIYPSQVTQTEPTIAVSPVNPQLLFASAVTLNTNNGFRSEGVYVSTDGGQQWFGSDTCTGELLVNHGGDPGVAIDPNGQLILTHIGSIFPGIFSHYSTNLGASWSPAYNITSLQPEDKGTITLDENPGSPFYGRVYAAWVNFVTPFPVLSAYSTNSGESWTTPATINTPPPARCSGGSITTGPNGEVYITWAGVTASTPFNEDFAGFASSTNGGAGWNVTQNIFDMNGINGTLPSKNNIRVNGLPQVVVDNSGSPRTGWIYIVTTEKNLAPAGSDPDIILHRSTDGGASWSSGIRVNQDQINNGKIQYLPAIDVDANGGVNIIYYDDRNTASDSTEVFLARSADGGNSWAETEISGHRFKPKPIVGGSSNYQGDHIALRAAGDRLYALWMDDFSGIYQVWLRIVDLNPNAINEAANILPGAVTLYQNYPNPFNPSTVIRYELSRSAMVRLTVYDVLGRPIAVLINNEKKTAGQHEITFNAENLPGGLYLYRLEADGFNSVKKMLLLK